MRKLVLGIPAQASFRKNSDSPISPSQAVPTLAPMLKNVLPSVVNISTQGIVAIQQHPQMNNPYFRRFAPRA
ncbi:hypothetical protein [Bathymodiolus japonicus methanotrophic gill symbiont]|uniref:hypothetical protein n=1 Tax=Bathymodiolus japonicus methanotrophic gill symbiont TaxID=113269 RepID=UPI001E459351|nr:hypothetical protein [Bathymodiolus japonicus methanotrophic gill symbiont]